MQTATRTATLRPSPTASITPAPTYTATASPTRTATATATPIPTPTATPLAVNHLQVISSGNISQLVRLGRIPAVGSMGDPTSGLASGFAFSPDGHLLALDGGLNVRLWDLAAGQVIRELAPPDPAYAPGSSIAFGPDGTQIARIYHLNRIVIWSAKTGEVLRELSGSATGETFTALAYASGGTHPRLVASAIMAEQPGLIFWDAITGDLLAESPSGSGEADGFRISPNGGLAVQAGRDGMVRFWNALTGKRTKQQILYACPDSLVGAAFTHGGGLLALACDGDNESTALTRIFLYEPNYYQPDNMHLFQVLRGELPSSGLMTFSRDSVLLAAVSGSSALGSRANQVTFWNIYTRAPQESIAGFTQDIRQLEFSPDGRLLVLQLSDGSVELWGVK